MKRMDLKGFSEKGPHERALLALTLGAELGERRRRPVARGRVPRPLLTKSLKDVAPLMRSLHGVRRESVVVRPGLLPAGPIRTVVGLVEDVVLSPVARKRMAQRALRRQRGETLDDQALRQLALGLVEPSPVARACSAYAYWQATGATHVVEPILLKCMDTRDEEEFDVATHCLAKVAPKRISRILRSAPAEADLPGGQRRVPSAPAGLPG